MCEENIRTRNIHIPTYHCRKGCYKYSFFPSALNNWFNLDDAISRLLTFTCSIQNSAYNIFGQKGFKFQTRLRFSYLNEHRFRHNFQDCLNPLCHCSLETEDTLHYLLQCYHFSQHRFDLMNSVQSVSDSSEFLCENVKKDTLLSGDSETKTKLF